MSDDELIHPECIAGARLWLESLVSADDGFNRLLVKYQLLYPQSSLLVVFTAYLIEQGLLEV